MVTISDCSYDALSMRRIAASTHRSGGQLKEMRKAAINRRLRILKRISTESLREAELQVADNALAHLIALAYAFDHPEFFRVLSPDWQTAGALRAVPRTEIMTLPLGGHAASEGGPK